MKKNNIAKISYTACPRSIVHFHTATFRKIDTFGQTMRYRLTDLTYLNRSAGGNVLTDFLALVQCPGYLACQEH